MTCVTSTFCILATGLFYIHEPIVLMRENPTYESKVVSQALFAEKITIKEIFGDWCHIITSDGYSGWVQSNSFVKLDAPYVPTLKISRLSAHLYRLKDIEYGPIKTVPYGSELKALDESDPRWIKIALPNGDECFVQKGDVAPEHVIKNKKDLVPFSYKFLGLPYTWGGRSSFGYDCSGFLQMLYRQIGVDLQRDSHQQILDDRFRSIAIEELEPGDLLFFGQSENQIKHIGMYIGDGQFIHATGRENKPWIRISKLTDFEWSGHPHAYYPYRAARQLINKASNI